MQIRETIEKEIKKVCTIDFGGGDYQIGEMGINLRLNYFVVGVGLLAVLIYYEDISKIICQKDRLVLVGAKGDGNIGSIPLSVKGLKD